MKLPEGFVLERNKSSLPEGFELVKQESTPQTPKQSEFAPEQIEEARIKAQEMLKNAGVDTSGWGVAKEGLKGFGKGLVSGVERALNGLTFGGYDWASDKIGLGSKERKKELIDLAGTPMKLAMGGTEIVSGMIPSIGLWKGASALANAIPTATKAGKVLSTSANLLKYPLTGGIEGGLSAGFDSDFQNTGRGATFGATANTVIPLAGYGIKKGISFLTPKALGFTTGSGTKSVEQAYAAGKRGSKEFLNNMRGKVDAEDVVAMAKNDIKGLKIARNNEYQKAMANIKGKEGVELKPILNKFKQISKTEAGGKKYLVDEDTAKFLKKAGEKINAFAKDPSKKTLGDYDNLKQAIGNINVGKEARRASQVQGELYNAIKDEIKKQAPIYDKIMQPYSIATEEIRNAEKALSLGKGASVDTTLRKLQSAFRETVASNYGSRGKLVEKIGGDELSDALSGQLMNTWLPRGLESKAGGITLGITSAKGLTSPASLAAFSPRLVGEGAYGLGKFSNNVGNVLSPDFKRATLLNIINELNRKGE